MDFRCVLEVLKLTIPEEVLLRFAIVSALWKKAAMCGELWWTFCQDRHIGAEYFSTFRTPLEAFRSLKSSHFLVFFDRDSMKLRWCNCEKLLLENNVSFQHRDVFLENSQMLLLPDMSIVVCGGGATPTSRVTKVCRDGSMTEMPHLKTSRMKLGAVSFKGKLYVFGGLRRNTELTSSENLAIDTGTHWFNAGNMLSSRSSFNPCGHNTRIYLCGGNAVQCEFYDSEERIFQPMSLTLDSESPTSTFMYNGELIILQHSAKYIMQLDTLFVKQKESLTLFHAYFAMRPVTVGSIFYWVDNGCSSIQRASVSSPNRWTAVALRCPQKVTISYDEQFNIIKEVEPESAWKK